jgi:hypothetical protein
MEAIMLFYRMIYTDKCLVENFFLSSGTLFVIDKASTALLQIASTFQFLGHNI